MNRSMSLFVVERYGTDGVTVPQICLL